MSTRTRPPSPSVVVSVAVDKALADLTAALYAADVRAGLAHADATARSRVVLDSDDVRRVLVDGLEHARQLERRQRDAQGELVAASVAEQRVELERLRHENRELKREVAKLRDPRREAD